MQKEHIGWSPCCKTVAHAAAAAAPDLYKFANVAASGPCIYLI